MVGKNRCDECCPDLTTKDTKAHEEGALGFNPLCNFVFFVVDEIRTLLADVGADTLVGRFSAFGAENSIRSTP